MRGFCILAIGFYSLALLAVAQEGSASLAGKVEDIRGVGVAGTYLDLRAEEEPYDRYRAIADSVGMFRFPALLSGGYTLDLQHSGFRRLLVKGIHISEGENQTLQILRIEVSSLDCGFHAVVDYLRLGGEQGSLTGRVEQGPSGRNRKPIGNTQVILICSKNTVCGAAKTDTQGGFSFQNLPSGSYSIRANHAGFYPLEESGYEVQEGLESISHPMYLERCPLANCDPRLRPKKPLPRCE